MPMIRISSLVEMRTRNEPLYAYGADFQEVADVRRWLIDGLLESNFTASCQTIAQSIMIRLNVDFVEKHKLALVVSQDLSDGGNATIYFTATSGETYTIHAGSPEHIERVRLGLLKN